MIVKTVRLTGVRCHETLVVDLGPGVSVLVGANGAGKTSVLEGIHMVLAGTSPRTAQPRELISWGSETLRVELEVLGDDGRLSTAALGYSESGERRLTADGAPLANTSRWEESLPVRMFLPDDVRLVRGSPRRRRRFLDRMAEVADATYREDLEAYEEALSQRNALLRRGIVGQEHSVWEALMARTGLRIVGARARTLQSVSGPYVRLHDLLAAAREEGQAALLYRTNAADPDEAAYRERLAQQRESDRRRTFTNLGPHRDDVRFTYEGRDLRSFGSQGEQRTALLALLLAERGWTAERTSRAPLLLLDDVMSELDEPRRRALVALLREGGQVVIATTDLHYFEAEELASMSLVRLPSPATRPGGADPGACGPDAVPDAVPDAGPDAGLVDVGGPDEDRRAARGLPRAGLPGGGLVEGGLAGAGGPATGGGASAGRRAGRSGPAAGDPAGGVPEDAPTTAATPDGRPGTEG